MSEAQPTKLFEDKHLLFFVAALAFLAWDYHDAPYLQRTGWSLSIPTAQQPTQPAPAVSSEALAAAAPVRSLLASDATTGDECRAEFLYAASLISQAESPINTTGDIENLFKQAGRFGKIGPAGLGDAAMTVMRTYLGGSNVPLDGDKPVRTKAIDIFNAMGTK